MPWLIYAIGVFPVPQADVVPQQNQIARIVILPDFYNPLQHINPFTKLQI
jgi:hypothetical protein